MTDKQIQQALNFWASHLRLNNWDIELEVVDELPQGYIGNVAYNAKLYDAKIWVCRGAKNIERTIIHELVHLVLVDLSDVEELVLERAVHQLERAFMTVKEAE